MIVLTTQFNCRSCRFIISFNPRDNEPVLSVPEMMKEAMVVHLRDGFKCKRPIIYLMDQYIWVPDTEERLG